MLLFWIKAGQLGPQDTNIIFWDQNRSVGPPAGKEKSTLSEEGQLELLVSDENCSLSQEGQLGAPKSDKKSPLSKEGQ